MARLAIAALAALPAAAADITVQFEEEGLRKVLGVFATYSGEKVRVPDDLAERPATILLDNVPIEGAIRYVCFSAGAAPRRTAEAWQIEDAASPAWRKSILEALEAKPLDPPLDRGVKLSDALGRLRASVGASFVIDPATSVASVEGPASPPGGTAFDWLVALAARGGPAFDVRWGVVLVTTEARLRDLPAGADATPPERVGTKEKRLKEALGERRVDLPEAVRSVDEALRALSKEIGVPIALDPTAMDDVARLRFAAPARGVTAAQALDLLLGLSGLRYEIREDSLVVAAR